MDLRIFSSYIVMADKKRSLIRAEYEGGMKMADIAKKYNLTKQRVDQILNHKKRQARQAVKYAIDHGNLKKQPCEVCGSENVEAHHDDYSNPLIVRWFCKNHHIKPKRYITRHHYCSDEETERQVEELSRIIEEMIQVDNPKKRVISFYLDKGTLTKLETIAGNQQHNRSTQVAFLIDEAYTAMFPHNGGLVDIQAPTDKPEGESK